MTEPTSLERKLDRVVQTGLLLAAQSDLSAIVGLAADAGMELSGAGCGGFLYKVDGGPAEGHMLYMPPTELSTGPAHLPVPPGSRVTTKVFEDEATVRSADITQDSAGDNLAGLLPGVRARSYLTVPVCLNSGEMLGRLIFVHPEANHFSAEAETLVSMIAAQAANAIENARVREQLRRKMDALETAEHQLQDAVKHMSVLAAIVECSDDGIVSKDLNGIITTWNAAACRIFGYSPDEIVGSSILRLIPPELQSEEITILRKIRSGERIDHYETVRVTKAGERINVSLSISPIRDASGRIVGASKILRDISERKRMEASLLQAEKISATGRMAATIAHEINNPLEAVVNLLYLAKSAVSDEEALSYLSSAESEVDRVSHIARQTLGFYRENASAISVDVASLAAAAAKVYAPSCKASGIELILELDSERSVVLRRGEIMQVISNLIANAIQAMAGGGQLSVTSQDTDTPVAGVLLTIRDTGTGIPADQLSRIFEAFYTTRGSIGTGIGLFVARQFVEAHGGSISVDTCTEPARHGTAMSVFLPAVNPYSASHE